MRAAGLALWAAGCVWGVDPFDGRVEAGYGCDVDDDCDEGLRCDGSVCTAGCIADDECEGAFGCGTPGDEGVAPDGCYERCVYDDECKAGFVCEIGDCVQP